MVRDADSPPWLPLRSWPPVLSDVYEPTIDNTDVSTQGAATIP
jgi:hypothetical protein